MKIYWDGAKQTADAVVKVIWPYCQRVEITGEVRRMQQKIQKINIIAVPRIDMDSMRSLRDLVNRRFGHLVGHGFPATEVSIRGGIPVDFSFTTTAQWGWCCFRTTGPKHYVDMWTSRFSIVTFNRYVENDILHQANGTAIPTPEEVDVFRALDTPYLEPEKRK